MHESLKAHGLGIKPHGNGLVITDLHGQPAAKASTSDHVLSAKQLKERFGEFQPYRSLRPVQKFSRYEIIPLHRSPERGELYSRYRSGIESRKNRLAEIKEREYMQLEVIRQEWAAKRREIEGLGIHKRNRRNLLTLTRKHEKEAITKAKLDILPEREAVRRETPYTSWQDVLKLEAGNGNEIALAVLRSRGEAVESEIVPQPKALVNDWSTHDHGYAAQTAIRAEYAEKEREVLERNDISSSGKKTLQAFLRMEQVAAEARTEGSDLGEIKRRIDGKDVVIFSLENGDTIRDTGKEVFYSGQDSKAERADRLYAEKK